MLRWLRRQAGVYREALRYGRRVADIRISRAVEDQRRITENAVAKADAVALGASEADLKQVYARGEGVIGIDTRFGRLHLRPKDTDLLVIRQVFVDEEYNIDALTQMEKIRARYQAILTAGEVPVIIDAGANIGAASLWFASHFPEARVIAVEPDPGNAAVARLNTATLPLVTVCEAAIGARAGAVKLQTFADQGWGARTERTEHSDDGVMLVTVSELLGSVSLGRLLIAKIDIEGFESDLFSENIDWIDEASAIFIEPHDWMLPGAGSSQSFQKALLGRGRELLIVGENLVFV